jgi:hypothetical protein
MTVRLSVSFWTLLDLSTNKENMMDVSKNNLEQAIASLRLSRGSSPACCNLEADVDALIAALDAARRQAGATVTSSNTAMTFSVVTPGFPDGTKLYAAPPAAMAVPAANVTPMRQPRADLARLVESINAAVYANGDGLSVTEAIGALELAKLELLKEQEQ